MQRQPRTALIFACIVPLALQLAQPSSCASDGFDRLRGRIIEALESDPAPSLAVAVVRDGRIVWEEGFGWADRERQIPAMPHTRYSIASISKPLTATGLMLLVDRGLIDLDRPIDEYLGREKVTARIGRPEDATVRRVSNHSAGLPLHHHFFYEDEPTRRPDMDETIRRHAVLVSAPGERYQYSNLGYGLIEYVIERAVGRTYAEFMAEEVFRPLGMTRTSVGLEEPRPDYALRYGPNGAPLPFYDFDHRGGSAIFSTAHDLARFALFHLRQPLPDARLFLSSQRLDEMQRSSIESGNGSQYGLGWQVSTSSRGYQTISHSGGMGGVSTQLTLVPSRRLAVVALANARSHLPGRITEEILRHLLTANLPPLTGTRPSPVGRAAVSMPGRGFHGIWRGFVRTYGEDVPLTLWVEPSGRVSVQLGEQPRVELRQVHVEDGYLRGVAPGHVANTGQADPHSIYIDLKLRGEVLNGSVTGFSMPVERVGNALSYWAELERD